MKTNKLCQYKYIKKNFPQIGVKGKEKSSSIVACEAYTWNESTETFSLEVNQQKNSKFLPDWQSRTLGRN